MSGSPSIIGVLYGKVIQGDPIPACVNSQLLSAEDKNGASAFTPTLEKTPTCAKAISSSLDVGIPPLGSSALNSDAVPKCEEGAVDRRGKSIPSLACCAIRAFKSRPALVGDIDRDLCGASKLLTSGIGS